MDKLCCRLSTTSQETKAVVEYLSLTETLLDLSRLPYDLT